MGVELDVFPLVGISKAVAYLEKGNMRLPWFLRVSFKEVVRIMLAFYLETKVFVS